MVPPSSWSNSKAISSEYQNPGCGLARIILPHLAFGIHPYHVANAPFNGPSASRLRLRSAKTPFPEAPYRQDSQWLYRPPAAVAPHRLQPKKDCGGAGTRRVLEGRPNGDGHLEDESPSIRVCRRDGPQHLSFSVLYAWAPKSRRALC